MGLVKVFCLTWLFVSWCGMFYYMIIAARGRKPGVMLHPALNLLNLTFRPDYYEAAGLKARRLAIWFQFAFLLCFAIAAAISTFARHK